MWPGKEQERLPWMISGRAAHSVLLWGSDFIPCLLRPCWRERDVLKHAGLRGRGCDVPAQAGKAGRGAGRTAQFGQLLWWGASRASGLVFIRYCWLPAAAEVLMIQSAKVRPLRKKHLYSAHRSSWFLCWGINYLCGGGTQHDEVKRWVLSFPPWHLRKGGPINDLSAPMNPAETQLTDFLPDIWFSLVTKQQKHSSVCIIYMAVSCTCVDSTSLGEVRVLAWRGKVREGKFKSYL